MKKTPERTVLDDPDQLFFDFASPPAPQRTSTASATSTAPSVCKTRPRSGAATSQRCVSTNVASLRASASEVLPQDDARAEDLPGPAFMTEARAAEIFMQVAHAQRDDEVRRAQVAFKPFRATLYSFKIRRGGAASVKLHVAFRRASEHVLTQAAQLMLTRRRKARRAVRRTDYDAFVRAIPHTDFELPGARRGHRVSTCGPGRYQSLEESFRRVNAEYFRAQLAQPELCWSPARARRILGSYQERSDRVIISQLFDRADMPAFVLDYLMFHELLHKFLGIGRHDNGKRCLHGAEFKCLERRFRHYKEAQRFLRKM